MKKWFILAAVLLILMLGSASAATLTGSGTEADPYLVGDYATMETALKAGGYIKLTADIPLIGKYYFSTFASKSATIDGQNLYGFKVPSTVTSWGNTNNTKHLANLAGGHTYKNLFFDCGGLAQGINVYQTGSSLVTLENVTIRNFPKTNWVNKISPIALTVNNSNVLAHNLTIGSGASMAINIDKKPSHLEVTGTEGLIEGVVFKQGGTIALKGGNYTNKPQDSYIALGYTRIDNGNKTWSVVKLHTIKFDTNGAGEIEPQQVRDGHTLVMPAQPTKKGMIFKGWYTDAACTVPFDPSAPITEELTLYVKWATPPAVVPVAPPAAPPAAPPVTGDSTPIALLAALMALSATAALRLRKRSA